MKLMTGLGYERFGAHGYDIGASILGLMCLDHPDRFIGYHTTSPGNPSPYVDSNAMLSAEEINSSNIRSNGGARRRLRPYSGHTAADGDLWIA